MGDWFSISISALKVCFGSNMGGLKSESLSFQADCKIKRINRYYRRISRWLCTLA